MSIATLMPELLTEIFLHHVSAFRDDDGEELPYQWIWVSHVSQHWRAVALNCTKLWSYIPLLRPECVEMMLARSGRAHLTLVFGPAHLTIDIGPPDELQDDDYFLNRNTESLKLALDHLHRIIEVKVRNTWSRCRELDALRNAPALERLEMDHYRLSWKDAMFEQRQLKELVVQGGPRFQTEDMLETLGNIPTLEVLALVGVIPHTCEDSNTLIITLPSLRLLRIWDDAGNISFLLDSIICPTTATLLLESPNRGGGFHSISNSISLKFDGETAIGNVQPLLALDIGQYTSDFSDTRLRGWTTTQSIDALQAQTDSPSFTFAFDSVMAPPDAIETLCEGLPLSTVRTLSVGHLHRFATPTASSVLFREATSVESLWISRWSVKRLLDAQILDLPDELMLTDGRQHSSSEMSLPHLTTLVLDNISSGSEGSGDVERLKAVLDLRHKCGGLELLILRQFNALARLYDGARDTDPDVLTVQKLAASN